MQKTVQTSIRSGKKVVLILAVLLIALSTLTAVWRLSSSASLPLPKGPISSNRPGIASWYPPKSRDLDNLDIVINGSGVYDFVFDSSTLPEGVPYGTYNWCNMPHVRPAEYPRVNDSYELHYVEVVHRHHKRTPYAANTFPIEADTWSCSDEGLFFSGAPLPLFGSNHSAATYWEVYSSQTNPLVPGGFAGSCQFPQITRGGLDDSWQHGRDLYDVYHGLLNFIPSTYDPSIVSYRVTNNVITSQVASMVIGGMYPEQDREHPTPLKIQPKPIDSLEPAYPCPAASKLYRSYAVGSSAPSWQAHLRASATLFSSLDAISKVDASDADWHNSWDHYFDNLSSRLCHAKSLPCSVTDSSRCITQAQADAVFRLGEYEYSHIYRGAGQQTLDAAVGSYGIWIAELAQNLRDAARLSSSSNAAGSDSAKSVKYRHNVAHDGSVGKLLAILQVEEMVWPGMGSEVVFELYQKKSAVPEDVPGSRSEAGFYIRVLWGGQVLRSSHPRLAVMDMLPLETLLEYFDTLVGIGASKVPGLCDA